MAAVADLTAQRFVLARLADYCDFRAGPPAGERDHALHLSGKLKELADPLYALKQSVLEDSVERLLAKKSPAEADLAELKQALDRLLAPSDYADAVFHLDAKRLADPGLRAMAADFLRGLRAANLLEQEALPEARRAPAWQKLVGEIRWRLGFDRVEAVLERRKPSALAVARVLRHCRLRTARYCEVLRFPKDGDDALTPFLLPRVEALAAANLRLLYALRRSG